MLAFLASVLQAARSVFTGVSALQNNVYHGWGQIFHVIDKNTLEGQLLNYGPHAFVTSLGEVPHINTSQRGTRPRQRGVEFMRQAAARNMPWKTRFDCP